MYNYLISILNSYIFNYNYKSNNNVSIEILNNDEIEYIANIIDNIFDLKSFSITNKSISKICEPTLKNEIVIHNHNQFLKMFPEWIHDLIGYKRLFNAPILEFEPRFIGGTNYIDCIQYIDVTNDIMVGIDHFRRPYLTLTELNDVIVTIFQRFTNDKNCWTTGCYGYSEISNIRRIYTDEGLINEDKDTILQNAKIFIS